MLVKIYQKLLQKAKYYPIIQLTVRNLPTKEEHTTCIQARFLSEKLTEQCQKRLISQALTLLKWTVSKLYHGKY